MSIITKIKKTSLTRHIVLVVYRLFCLLPVKKNVVIFESFLGKQYSCNPRAIYEAMCETHPNYEMYWSVDGRYLKNFEGKNVQILKRFSFQWFYLMARANYWIFNSRTPVWLPKSKHTIYVQTWHGTPLKKLGSDIEEVHMPGTTTEQYRENFYKESRKWDYLISQNAYSTEIFRRCFNFDKEMLEIGYPRNDFLVNNHNEESMNVLKKRYGLPLDKKVVLYAPTWRDNQFYAKGRYKMDIQLDLDRMQQEFGNDYIVIMRLHYLVAENLDLSAYKGFAYDFSNHEDIRELYVMADLLITDYSSVFFDYAILQRPIIFFTYDIDEYRNTLRGFYFDLEKHAPGPIVKTMDELMKSIAQIQQQGMSLEDRNKINAFRERFCYLDNGQASEECIKRIRIK